jgi:hypothetical protein
MQKNVTNMLHLINSNYNTNLNVSSTCGFLLKKLKLHFCTEFAFHKKGKPELLFTQFEKTNADITIANSNYMRYDDYLIAYLNAMKKERYYSNHITQVYCPDSFSQSFIDQSYVLFNMLNTKQ